MSARIGPKITVAMRTSLERDLRALAARYGLALSTIGKVAAVIGRAK